MFRKLQRIGLAVILLGLSSATNARAFGPDGHNLGLGLGVGILNPEGTQFSYGINYRYKMDNLGFGFSYIGNLLANVSNGFATATLTQNHFDFDVDYYFMPEVFNGLWAGARFGLAARTLTVSIPGLYTFYGDTVSSSASLFAFDFGPAVGYDFTITELISGGLDVSYLASTYATMKTALQILVVGKYRF